MKDLYLAILKGNLKLIYVAKTKIKYLKKVINPQLLEEGVKGEEEALCSIQSFLLNSGWWVKANNLNLKELGVDIGKCDSVLIREENDIMVRLET